MEEFQSKSHYKQSLSIIWIFLTLFMSFPNQNKSIKFYFYMEPTSMRCLAEYLSDKTSSKIMLY